MIIYTVSFILSGILFTLFLYFFTVNRQKTQKALHEQNAAVLENIMNKANMDFDKSLYEQNKNIAGCIEGFFNELFITNYIEYLISTDRIIMPSLFVIINCLDSDLTREEAENAGKIIKTEFNGKIISAVSKNNSRPNYTFYTFFEGYSEKNVNEFLNYAICRLEKELQKKFTYSINNIKPKF